MKKSILMIIIGLVGITLSLAYKNIIYKEEINTPDSGWDYDYDGGSSSSDSSSSSSSDWGSSSSDWSNDRDYDYRSSSSGSRSTGKGKDWSDMSLIEKIIMVILYIFLAVVTIGPVIYIVVMMVKGIYSLIKKIHGKSASKRKLFDDKIYVSNLNAVSDDVLNANGLNRDEILNKAFTIYRDVQYAWSNFDYESLRKNLSDELFNEYSVQLDAMKVQGKQNIMKDIVLKESFIRKVENDNGIITIDIDLYVNQKDYVVNSNNINKPIRGDKKDHMVGYSIRYVLSNEVSNKCPNCGMKLDDKASVVCPSCGAVVTNSSHDMVMVKKQITVQ